MFLAILFHKCFLHLLGPALHDSAGLFIKVLGSQSEVIPHIESAFGPIKARHLGTGTSQIDSNIQVEALRIIIESHMQIGNIATIISAADPTGVQTTLGTSR